MNKKDRAKLQASLNKTATETMVANENLFLVGACRLFELWANRSVLCHLKTERDSDGEIVSWQSEPRFLPHSEMLKVFPNLKVWAECEQTVLEEIPCVVSVFAGTRFWPSTQADVEPDIDDIEPDGAWQGVVSLFFECLLQALLRANGWGCRELSLWCEKDDDAPDYVALFEKLAEITPTQALQISTSADLSEFTPDSPPYCRLHGWMPPLVLGGM